MSITTRAPDSMVPGLRTIPSVLLAQEYGECFCNLIMIPSPQNSGLNGKKSRVVGKFTNAITVSRILKCTQSDNPAQARDATIHR